MEQTSTAFEPVFIGIDVSKDRLDVAVLPSGEICVTIVAAIRDKQPCAALAA